jgi:hypothetical protein
VVYRVLADAVVLGHMLFVGFVVAGGFLAWRWPWVVWAHAPAAAWGAAIEYGGWTCPLTPLENAFRTRAGLAGYRGGFVEQHLLPLLYPAGLTAPKQAVLGTLVVVVNALAYGVVIRRTLRRARGVPPRRRDERMPP